MNRLFPGGIHPAGHKEISSYSDSAPLVSPTRVVIPLRQHIGAPCRPLVAVGDRVAMGQPIGDGEDLCVPVHSSISGRVTAIGDAPYPTGGTVSAVTIDNDHEERWFDELCPHPAPEELDREGLFTLMRTMGLVGMGGAAFPTHAKAASSAGKIDTLLINGCECEPYITADDFLLRTRPRQVLDGIRLLARALRPARTVLALEDNKPRAIAALREHPDRFPGLELRVLPTRYPQGGEKQLIQAVTGREVTPGKLPADLGCAVFNVSTAAALSQAVYDGLPLIRRIVTVTGEGVRRPGNFLVPIGTSFAQVIRAAGGLAEGALRVVAGGPMMGVAQPGLEVPVIKSTNCILCLPGEGPEERPRCIRCGKCLDACPVHLQPLYLYRYELAGDLKALERLNLTDCMECGCCSYVCPGKLPLVERFRAGKRALKEGKST